MYIQEQSANPNQTNKRGCVIKLAKRITDIH